jgi:hypothetical protein
LCEPWGVRDASHSFYSFCAGLVKKTRPTHPFLCLRVYAGGW